MKLLVLSPQDSGEACMGFWVDRKHRPLGTWRPLLLIRQTWISGGPDAVLPTAGPRKGLGDPARGHPSTDESQRCRERLLEHLLHAHSLRLSLRVVSQSLRSEPQSLAPTRAYAPTGLFEWGMFTPLYSRG